MRQKTGFRHRKSLITHFSDTDNTIAYSGFFQSIIIDKINENAPGLPVSDEASVQERPNASSSAPPEEVSAKVPTVDSLENDKQEASDPEDQEAAPSEFIFPVKDDSAKISNPYSMDKLIYSLTLDQYMTHSGIDIEAPEDTQVLAIAEGTVTSTTWAGSSS